MTDHYWQPPEPCCEDDDCRCIAAAIEDAEDRLLEMAENRTDIERFGP